MLFCHPLVSFLPLSVFSRNHWYRSWSVMACRGLLLKARKMSCAYGSSTLAFEELPGVLGTALLCRLWLFAPWWKKPLTVS